MMEQRDACFGRYRLHIPQLPLAKPRLFLQPAGDPPGVQGSLRLYGRRIPLRVKRAKRGHIRFLITAGPFDLELVVTFEADGRLTGLLDTPLFFLRFQGFRLPRRSRAALLDTHPTLFSLNIKSLRLPGGLRFRQKTDGKPDGETCPEPQPGIAVRKSSDKPTGAQARKTLGMAAGSPNGMMPRTRLVLPGQPPTALRFTPHEESGAFLCLPFGQPWLGDRLGARIGKHRAIATHTAVRPHVDAYGPCRLWEIRYESPANPKRTFVGRIRLHADFAIFESEQSFGVHGKPGKDPFGYPYIAFPSFEGSCWQDGLSVLTYKRQAPFHAPVRWRGRLFESFREGRNLPIIATDDYNRTIVLSPLSPLLHATVSLRHDPPEIRCGLPRALHRLPAGTVCRTLLTWGDGVNDTIDHWSRLLATFHDAAPIRPDADVLLEKISYWTNAGSAYWYNTVRGSSYAMTLRLLRHRHAALGLRFGSYQLDSWWYQREHDGYTGGILDWAPRPEAPRRNYNVPVGRKKVRRLAVFPLERMSDAQAILDAPLGCHFKQLSIHSPHVAASPDDFLCEDFAMPRSEAQAVALFRTLFSHPRWRLAYVVHDWLQWMSDRHTAFRDPELGPGYFRALDAALRSLPAPDNRCGHPTLQLCMTQPSMTLNAVTLPAVTTIRSTPDAYSFFLEGPRRWWWHLFSARFIEAVGRHAFYDNRRSSGFVPGRRAAWTDLEFRWLCLSGGPVGLSDRIGRENMARIQRCILADGALLKPDQPARPLDRCFLMPSTHKGTPCGPGHTGLLVSAASHVRMGGDTVGQVGRMRGETGGQIGRMRGDMGVQIARMRRYTIHYVLGANRNAAGRKAPLRFSLTEAGADRMGTWAVRDLQRNRSHVRRPTDEYTYRPGAGGTLHLICAPLIDGIAFFGDTAKHVSADARLIRRIRCTRSGWTIHGTLSGNQPARWIFHARCAMATARLDGEPHPISRRGDTYLQSSGKRQTGDYTLEVVWKEDPPCTSPSPESDMSAWPTPSCSPDTTP